MASRPCSGVATPPAAPCPWRRRNCSRRACSSTCRASAWPGTRKTPRSLTDKSERLPVRNATTREPSLKPKRRFRPAQHQVAVEEFEDGAFRCGQLIIDEAGGGDNDI